MKFDFDSSWKKALAEELEQPYLEELARFVESERERAPVYPDRGQVFQALNLTPYERVKVVIVGQDPYHGPGQAHGLSFSVPRGVPPPPSLQNLFKELRSDVGLPAPSHGCLESWAEQGVLLLNAILTVRRGEPASHQKRGWEQFTDAVIAALCEKSSPPIFLLWGRYAQEKAERALDGRAEGLRAAHPSPFSARQGFFGCRHFSKANDYLFERGIKPIDWRLPA